MIVEPLVFSLANRTNLSVFTKGKKYIGRANVPFPDRLFAYNLFEEIPKNNLFEPNFLQMAGEYYDPFDSFRLHYSCAPAKTELGRQLYMDLKLAISDNDLFKVTRMTEGAEVKVQFPFLDYRLSDFAAAIPDKIKMRRGNLRSFFKGAYVDLLPTSTRKKEKHGFGLPIPVWLRTDKRLNEMMCDLVLGPTAIQRGYYQKKTLEMLVERHSSDLTGFYGTTLWNLMVIEAWHRRCGG
jgi:asparagine synthase (glutamine-hydrolysing)